ncbi:MAG: IdeS/Mac family cysteine endopeptidase [Candidatus Saccharibacteria bacterium]|nr:IdeS/Mac family cysteine endopeptidase [Candidatus Saccharibacteria bacterium]
MRKRGVLISVVLLLAALVAIGCWFMHQPATNTPPSAPSNDTAPTQQPAKPRSGSASSPDRTPEDVAIAAPAPSAPHPSVTHRQTHAPKPSPQHSASAHTDTPAPQQSAPNNHKQSAPATPPTGTPTPSQPDASDTPAQPAPSTPHVPNTPQQPNTPAPAPQPEKPAQPTPTPTPPRPQPTPPAAPTDEEKARRIYNALKSQHNTNIAQFTNDEGHIRTVLWAKGITAPRLGTNGDFVRDVTNTAHGNFVDYIAPYAPGNGWYDIDKALVNEQDANLCFAATAGNMLHWWYDRNSAQIARFIAQQSPLPPHVAGTLKDPATYRNSFTSQQQSRFFDMYKVHFGYNQRGFFADLLIDLFINGHTPKPNGGTNENWEYMDNFRVDPRGGLFHSVFGKKPLTDRTFGGNYSGLNRQVRNILRNGDIAGLAYTVLGRTTGHIVTLWGAEYDLDGNIVGVYVTDSDDKDYALNGMKRYSITNHNGAAILSNNTTHPTRGSKIDYIHILSAGTAEWDRYFTQQP